MAKPRLPAPQFSLYRLPPPTKYAVVYSADADLGLLLNAQLGQLLQGGEDVEPHYAVGIGYGTTDFMRFMELRQRDLPPTVDSTAPTAAWGAGGASRFLRFIQEELKPIIERRYPVDPARSIISGLSHGGLFPLWVPFNHPESFAGYIALDPASWDKASAIGSKRKSPGIPGRSRASGSTWPSRIRCIRYRPCKPRPAPFGIGGWRFCERVRGRGYPGLIFHCEAHEKESHFSVVGPGLTQGLRWVLPIDLTQGAKPGG